MHYTLLIIQLHLIQYFTISKAYETLSISQNEKFQVRNRPGPLSIFQIEIQQFPIQINLNLQGSQIESSRTLFIVTSVSNQGIFQKDVGEIVDLYQNQSKESQNTFKIDYFAFSTRSFQHEIKISQNEPNFQSQILIGVFSFTQNDSLLTTDYDITTSSLTDSCEIQCSNVHSNCTASFFPERNCQCLQNSISKQVYLGSKCQLTALELSHQGPYNFTINPLTWSYFYFNSKMDDTQLNFTIKNQKQSNIATTLGISYTFKDIDFTIIPNFEDNYSEIQIQTIGTSALPFNSTQNQFYLTQDNTTDITIVIGVYNWGNSTLYLSGQIIQINKEQQNSDNLNKTITNWSLIGVGIFMFLLLAFLGYLYLNKKRIVKSERRIVPVSKVDEITLEKEMPRFYFQDVGDRQFTNENCTICLLIFEPDQICRITMCQHIFHAKCIDHWLQDSDKCPNCRQGLGFWDFEKHKQQLSPQNNSNLIGNELDQNHRGGQLFSPNVNQKLSHHSFSQQKNDFNVELDGLRPEQIHRDLEWHDSGDHFQKKHLDPIQFMERYSKSDITYKFVAQQQVQQSSDQVIQQINQTAINQKIQFGLHNKRNSAFNQNQHKLHQSDKLDFKDKFNEFINKEDDKTIKKPSTDNRQKIYTERSQSQNDSMNDGNPVYHYPLSERSEKEAVAININ